MKRTLISLIISLREHQNQIIIDYFCLAAFSWQYWVKNRSITMSAILVGTGATLAILMTFAYILNIILYLIYPNYFDHAQPIVASISWLWMHGHELYPNWMTGDVYGLVYGPLIFLINGIPLLMDSSIFASKLPGVLSLSAALVVTWTLLKRATASSIVSLFLFGSLIILFETFGVYAYWNRPEPFLVLVSALALLAAFWPSSLVAGVTIGILAGVATGLKLHGFIYTAPAAAAALSRVETPPGRLLVALIGSACAVGSVLLLYMLKGVSMVGYFQFLKVAFVDGFSVSNFIENVLLAFIVTAPILGIWILRKSALRRLDRYLLVALALSIAFIVVIGAKKGGGTYYLLPLMPICIYAIAVVCGSSSKTRAKEVTALVFASFLFAYGPHFFLSTRELIYSYQETAASEHKKILELKHYLSSYPDAQIGISDDEHYSDYYYRVLSVWSGRPLHVDFGVWMDLAYAGIDEKYVARFIQGCLVQKWILPLGMPFTKINWYSHRPMLSEDFRRTFLANYQQIETGKAYQVWRCKTNSRIE